MFGFKCMDLNAHQTLSLIEGGIVNIRECGRVRRHFLIKVTFAGVP